MCREGSRLDRGGEQEGGDDAERNGVGPGTRSEGDLEVPVAALRRLVEAGAKPRAAASVVAELTGTSANALYRALTAAQG